MTGEGGGKVHSMTGFGRSEGSDGRYRWAWELRSVNGRGLDVRMRVGMGFERLDQQIRKRLTGAFARGSLSVSLDLRSHAEQPDIQVNEAFLGTLEEICRARGQDARIDRLLGVRGVVDASDERQSAAEDADRCAAVLQTLDEAIGGLREARLEEGGKTADVLMTRVAEIEDLVQKAAALDSARLPAIRDRMMAQIEDLLGTSDAVDPERLAQEVALLATKADIREELDRLTAHVGAARGLLKGGGPVGRKLDFLSQEFNREANTLCSKSSDTALTKIGLDLKAVIDQVKEQSANLE